jgi:hypothetical protein
MRSPPPPPKKGSAHTARSPEPSRFRRAEPAGLPRCLHKHHSRRHEACQDRRHGIYDIRLHQAPGQRTARAFHREWPATQQMRMSVRAVLDEYTSLTGLVAGWYNLGCQGAAWRRASGRQGQGPFARGESAFGGRRVRPARPRTGLPARTDSWGCLWAGEKIAFRPPGILRHLRCLCSWRRCRQDYFFWTLRVTAPGPGECRHSHRRRAWHPYAHRHGSCGPGLR